jgi:hypothetical protein
VVEHLDVPLDPAQIIGVAAVLEHHVAAKAEIGAVELEDQPGGDDRLIFRPHRLGERFEIGVLVGIEVVGLEQRDHARARPRS